MRSPRIDGVVPVSAAAHSRIGAPLHPKSTASDRARSARRALGATTRPTSFVIGDPGSRIWIGRRPPEGAQVYSQAPPPPHSPPNGGDMYTPARPTSSPGLAALER